MNTLERGVARSTAPLTIYIHLEDGRVAEFAQQDVAVARQMMSRIQPARLFSDDALILGGEHTTVAFQTATVVRVDLVTDFVPNWPYQNDIVDAQEITQDEFEQRLRLEQRRPKDPEWLPSANKMETVFLELELVNGSRVFIQVRTRPFKRTPLDERLLLHRFFTSGGLHARRHDGGVMLVNPARIARLAIYPGQVAPPQGIWQASYVSG